MRFPPDGLIMHANGFLSFDAGLPVFAGMPSYFGRNRFSNPSDALNGPFQYAHGQNHVFEWMSKNPYLLEAFLPYIYGTRKDRPSWMDEGFYPVTRLTEGLDTEGDTKLVPSLMESWAGLWER